MSADSDGSKGGAPGPAAVRARMDAALQRRGHLVLDGPTGTELEARGYRSHPSLWTATAAVDAPVDHHRHSVGRPG